MPRRAGDNRAPRLNRAHDSRGDRASNRSGEPLLADRRRGLGILHMLLTLSGLTVASLLSGGVLVWILRSPGQPTTSHRRSGGKAAAKTAEVIMHGSHLRSVVATYDLGLAALPTDLIHRSSPQQLFHAATSSMPL